MESTLNDLKSRRSIRNFQDRQISDEELQKILEAGIYAPTGMGMQSPKLVAIQNKEVIKKLSALNAGFLSGPDGRDPFYGAPCIIVVLADPSVFTHVEDGSLVLGNMLNAAHALGIGSCWIHRACEEFASEEGKALLKSWGITGDYVGIGHCILGYPADEQPPEAKPRKVDYITYVK